MNRVQAILNFCSQNNIELIVINPNGFSYALFNDACSDEANALDEMLDNLTQTEVLTLRQALSS